MCILLYIKNILNIHLKCNIFILYFAIHAIYLVYLFSIVIYNRVYSKICIAIYNIIIYYIYIIYNLRVMYENHRIY